MNVISRRDFLKAGGAAALGLGLGPTLLLRPALAAERTGRRRKVFVHLFQRGGCDGLSAVVPYAEREYYQLRRATALPPPGKQNGCVKLNGRFGLHPALADLAPDYEAGRLAIVHAVGSHDSTRSHFDAQDYMETGTPGRKGTADGWLNRYVTSTLGDEDSTFRAVALTPTLPRVMKGDARTLAIASFNQFTFGGRGRQRGGTAALGDAFGRMYGTGEEDELHRSGTEAFQAVERLRRINPGKFAPRNGAQYPRGRLGQSMLQIAQLIKADVGLELAFTDCGGWDTHLNQGGAFGSLANRLREVGQALHAFALDLGDRMEDVVVVTMTEFGRTAKENGTAGTDHGHGSLSFVLGGPVVGGRVHGKWPGLAQSQLWQRRDLAVTTDFRDVISDVLANHMGTKDLKKVFPGHQAKRLGVIGRVA
jgi:uncharacterized protein (DUF1501 family)